MKFKKGDRFIWPRRNSYVYTFHGVDERGNIRWSWCDKFGDEIFWSGMKVDTLRSMIEDGTSLKHVIVKKHLKRIEI